MKVLIACEFSGVVREAFRKRGHDAWSCDLLPTEIPGPHYRTDIRNLFLPNEYGSDLYTEDRNITYPNFDLMIAHPPCTYLANSGVRWLHTQPDRWDKMVEGAHFFKTLLEAPIPHIAVENPIMHKYAVEIIGRRQDQIVQPWMFGHGETKATGFWLKNLPPLKPTNIVDGREGRVWKESPGPDRWKNRSRTLQGIAEAMADQWGGFLVGGIQSKNDS